MVLITVIFYIKKYKGCIEPIRNHLSDLPAIVLLVTLLFVHLRIYAKLIGIAFRILLVSPVYVVSAGILKCIPRVSSFYNWDLQLTLHSC